MFETQQRSLGEEAVENLILQISQHMVWATRLGVGGREFKPLFY